MTIRRPFAKARIDITCDGPECAYVLRTGTHVFADAIAKAKEAGMLIKPDGNTFQHFCTSCRDHRR